MILPSFLPKVRFMIQLLSMVCVLASMRSFPILPFVLYVILCRYVAATEQPATSIQYIFRVTTCNTAAASSNSPVLVKFKGTNKTTDYMPLEEMDRRPVIHRSGVDKTYSLSGPDVGPLTELLILVEQGDDWCFQSPRVTVPAHGNIYHFTDGFAVPKTVTHLAVKKTGRIPLHRPALQVYGLKAAIVGSSAPTLPPMPTLPDAPSDDTTSTASSFDTLSYALIGGAALLVLLGCGVLCCVYCNKRKKRKRGDESTMSATSTGYSSATQGSGVGGAPPGRAPPGKAPPGPPNPGARPAAQDEGRKSPKSKTAKSVTIPEDSEKPNIDAKAQNGKGKKEKQRKDDAKKSKSFWRKKGKKSPPPTAPTLASTYVPLTTPTGTADDMQTAQEY